MRIDYYSTTDLGLAAYLSLFFPIDAIDKRETTKYSFIFIKNLELENLLEAYWKHKVQVNPQDYFNAIKNVKSRLYQD